MTITYRIALAASRAFIAGYGRLTVSGCEHIPQNGPVLIISNHDSPLDAFIIAVAVGQQRQIRVLTKKSLWRHRPVAFLLDRLHQIPIERGGRDGSGIEAAAEALQAGHCLCVFPEGTLSRGQRLRIRGGAASLLASVPDAALVGCAVTGATTLQKLRFGARVMVTFIATSSGVAKDAGEATCTIEDLMNTIRTLAPPS